MEDMFPMIHQIAKEIGKLVSANTIWLFARKSNMENNTSSFKLCVIVPTEDKMHLLRRIYSEVDCDVPFDVVLYTPKEWEDAMESTGSFAQKIARTGRVVYG